LTKYLKVLRHTKSEGVGLELSVPLEEVPRGDIWTHAFQLAFRWLHECAGLDEIPISIVQFGRRYADQHFFDCVGECLDIVPALSSGAPDAIQDLIAYASRHNINFLALSLDPVLKRAYPRLAEFLNPDIYENQMFGSIL